MRRKSTGHSICIPLFMSTIAALCALTADAADWPTYLHDFNRAGATDEQLRLPLDQNWVHAAPVAIRRAWTEPEGRTAEGRDLYDRVRFDDAFQVAVVGDNVYFGSSVDHKVYCLDARTGAECWHFFTGAAVRLAPTVADGRVYVGSDDGYAYCLDGASGELIWKYRPGPAEEWFLGRGEMISRWPVRTSILVDGDVAYFGAGIFPHENVYMCAVHAADGRVIWRNDNISHLEAGREDLSPQGYLLASPNHVFVPSGRTRPKSFDRRTGELLGAAMTQLSISSGAVAGTSAIMINGRLHLCSPGSHVAGTGAATFVTTGDCLARLDSKSYGKLSATASKLKNQQRDLFRQRREESIDDQQYQEQTKRISERIRSLDETNVAWRVPCSANSALIVAGAHVFVGGTNEVIAFESSTGRQVWRANVDGDARGLAAANGQLFVSTSNGRVYSFCPAGSEPTKSDLPDTVASPYAADMWSETYEAAAGDILKRTGVRRGFCLVVGSENGRLAYELARQSDLRIYGIEGDEKKVDAARQALSKAGLYGHRVTIHHTTDASIPYSNYFANLIVSDRLLLTGQLPADASAVARHLKPAGGVICLGQPDTIRERGTSVKAIRDWLHNTKLDGQSIIGEDRSWVTLTRTTLPGAGNWSHQYAEPGNTANSGDKLVQGGLGVLWYGDPGPEMMVDRHQGAVGPLVVNGRMFIQGERSLMAYDAYNGLPLWKVENLDTVRTGVFQNRAPGNLAASDDLLFHMARDRVFAHDIATGEVKAIYTLPASVNHETHEWGYVAFRDGRLFGTATTREVLAREFRRRGNPGAAATDTIFAIDVATGNHLWAYQGASINFQAIAIAPNRVFFIDSSITSEQREEILRQGKTELMSLTGEAAKLAEQRMKSLDVRLAVAIDGRTGSVLWKKPVDVTDCSNVGAGGGKLTLMYRDNTLVLCGANANGHYWKQFIEGEFKRRRLVALSATTGDELWSRDANYRHRPIIVGNRIIAEPWSFDRRTGEQETRRHPLTGAQVPWSLARPGHHCGMLAGSDHMLVFRSGFTGFYDLKTDSGTRHFAGHRLGCWINALPTNGLVVMPEASVGCVCMFSIASTIVMEPREPRRPWSLFSQIGPSTPVRQLALNFGAPGDRRDQSGKLWLSWPRPSDKPRNPSTEDTSLALDLDIRTTFLQGGGFVSRDGDATITNSPELTWISSSGGRGLARFSIPLLGADDAPTKYTVRLHFAPDVGREAGNQVCHVSIQGKRVLTNFDATAEREDRIVREFTSVKVTDNLLVELTPMNGSTDGAYLPVVCGVEVIQTDGSANTLTRNATGRLAAAQREQAAPAQATIRLEGRVLDAETGRLIPARVYIQAENGDWFFPKSISDKGSAVEYRKQRTERSHEMHTTLSAHPFAVHLRPGKYQVIVERGKEYFPVAREVMVGRQPVDVEFRLRRWIDMGKLGWYSGDTHVHRTLEELPNCMLAEDLNVTFPLLYWESQAFAAPRNSPRSFAGQIEPKPIRVDDTHVIYPRNTEYEIGRVGDKRHTLGAFFVLNHQTVFDLGVPPVGPVAERARLEGGLIELDKHAWPWSMMLVPVMPVDLFELSNNHIWRTEFAFKTFGEPAAEYMNLDRDNPSQPYNERGWMDYGFENYYALLNCGFRLRPTAGTASGVHPVPLGFGRVYVHLPDGFRYDAWVDGLNRGRSFVTTGPMLFVNINNKEPGHTFHQKTPGQQTYHVSGSALSPQPLARIEIVVNGEIAQRLAPSNHPRDHGGYESLFRSSLEIDQSSWIVVRCFEERANRRLRFAHSSPVHVDVADSPLRPRRRQVDFLIQRIEDQLARSAEVLPEAALAEYRKALDVYQKIRETARD